MDPVKLGLLEPVESREAPAGVTTSDAGVIESVHGLQRNGVVAELAERIVERAVMA